MLTRLLYIPWRTLLQTLSAVEKELLLRRVSKYAGLAEEVSDRRHHPVCARIS